MQDYVDIFDNLLDLIIAHETDELVGKPCGCGLAHRTTRCDDCFQSKPTCDMCFVASHRNAPLHWAERWNGGFFERLDISHLGHIITLGHRGDPCRNSTPIRFIVTDRNGIHDTRLAFCRCISVPNDVDQLMRARIFPGSIKSPSSGFTFDVLKDFHLQTLESKKSAYDFIAGLRRRSNNAFPSDVPVSMSIFIQKILMFSLNHF
jgi:hypothetical protein